MPAADAPIRLLVVEDSELDYELLQAILLRDRETLGGRVPPLPRWPKARRGCANSRATSNGSRKKSDAR